METVRVAAPAAAAAARRSKWSLYCIIWTACSASDQWLSYFIAGHLSEFQEGMFVLTCSKASISCSSFSWFILSWVPHTPTSLFPQVWTISCITCKLAKLILSMLTPLRNELINPICLTWFDLINDLNWSTQLDLHILINFIWSIWLAQSDSLTRLIWLVSNPIDLLAFVGSVPKLSL